MAALPFAPIRAQSAPMPSEAESCVAAFFHTMRAASKRKPVPGADRIAAAIAERIENDHADELAERDLAERALE